MNIKMGWDSTMLKHHVLGVVLKRGKEKVAKHLFVAFPFDSLVFKKYGPILPLVDMAPQTII